MRPIITLVRKDFALLFKDRSSMILTFAVPFAMIYLFGFIFNVNGKDSGPSGVPVAVVNQSDNPGAQKLVDALRAEKTFRVITDTGTPDKKGRPLTEEDLRPMMKADDFRFALVIPKDLVRSDRIGLHLKVYSNPRNEIESNMVEGVLMQTLFAHVPELLGQSLQERAKAFLGAPRLDRFNRTLATTIADTFGGSEDRILERIKDGSFGFNREDNTGAGTTSPATTNQVNDFIKRIIAVDTVKVQGDDIKSPAATMLVGGWAIQFLLFAVSASATALFRERDAGLFQRVLSSPASRSDILWSKFIYGVCLGLIQLLTLFMAGQLLYGVNVTGHLGLLILVSLFASAACAGFGMLIASVASTPEAARGLSTFTIMLMSAIGGAWFPLSFMPLFIQKLSKLTLVFWSMEGFSQVLWANAGLAELLPILGVLGLITLAVTGVSVWRFRTGHIFE
jgi:ABC-2 type transport system permease protein